MRLYGIFEACASQGGKVKQLLEFVSQCADALCDVTLGVVVVTDELFSDHAHLITMAAVSLHLKLQCLAQEAAHVTDGRFLHLLCVIIHLGYIILPY